VFSSPGLCSKSDGGWFGCVSVVGLRRPKERKQKQILNGGASGSGSGSGSEALTLKQSRGKLFQNQRVSLSSPTAPPHQSHFLTQFTQFHPIFLAPNPNNPKFEIQKITTQRAENAEQRAEQRPFPALGEGCGRTEAEYWR